MAEGYAISHASVGYNFFFGKGRGGNPRVLAEEGRLHGFGVTVVEAQGNDGDMFSSTRIRELLAEGDVTAAAEMLGSWWRISGVVVGGAGRGTIMGFPTANIRLDEGVTLMHGIYAVNAYVEGRKLRGAAYLGTRPTFDAGLPVLEIFVFDFDGDLYGKKMEVEFIGFIREDSEIPLHGGARRSDRRRLRQGEGHPQARSRRAPALERVSGPTRRRSARPAGAASASLGDTSPCK